MQHVPPLVRCLECLSVGCHRVDCETGARERAEKAARRSLDRPPVNRMLTATPRRK
ncbi:MAG TPA: hypothetical protein VFA70_04270 [Dehalococcoidia bacterium]|nr:hypothetical protein [Dehalococcoidia bacterium]